MKTATIATVLSLVLLSAAAAAVAVPASVAQAEAKPEEAMERSLTETMDEVVRRAEAVDAVMDEAPLSVKVAAGVKAGFPYTERGACWSCCGVCAEYYRCILVSWIKLGAPPPFHPFARPRSPR
jgi:hypothetical protein